MTFDWTWNWFRFSMVNRFLFLPLLFVRAYTRWPMLVARCSMFNGLLVVTLFHVQCSIKKREFFIVLNFVAGNYHVWRIHKQFRTLTKSVFSSNHLNLTSVQCHSKKKMLWMNPAASCSTGTNEQWKTKEMKRSISNSHNGRQTNQSNNPIDYWI